MSFVNVALIILLVGAVFGAAWYLLIVTEGVYLGQRVVIWLYDIYARRYDAIKKFDADWDTSALVQPLLNALGPIWKPLVLDVATGTARLPHALLSEPDFDGAIIGLDYSRQMLAVAAAKIAACPHDAPVMLIYQDAQALPFDDCTFDAVACLEALEFTPNPDAVIAELVRVARPGAPILITNRKGMHLMPGKTQPAKVLAHRLEQKFGLEAVRIETWQVDYEQVWARKGGKLTQERRPHQLPFFLRCPCCSMRTLTVQNGQELVCATCEAHTYIGTDGIIEYATVDCEKKKR